MLYINSIYGKVYLLRCSSENEEKLHLKSSDIVQPIVVSIEFILSRLNFM